MLFRIGSPFRYFYYRKKFITPPKNIRKFSSNSDEEKSNVFWHGFIVGSSITGLMFIGMMLHEITKKRSDD